MMSLYDYVVENDEIQKACDKINAIIWQNIAAVNVLKNDICQC